MIVTLTDRYTKNTDACVPLNVEVLAANVNTIYPSGPIRNSEDIANLYNALKVEINKSLFNAYPSKLHTTHTQRVVITTLGKFPTIIIRGEVIPKFNIVCTQRVVIGEYTPLYPNNNKYNVIQDIEFHCPLNVGHARTYITPYQCQVLKERYSDDIIDIVKDPTMYIMIAMYTTRQFIKHIQDRLNKYIERIETSKEYVESLDDSIDDYMDELGAIEEHVNEKTT